MPDIFPISSVSATLPAAAGSVSTPGIKASNVASTGGGELRGDHAFVLSLPALTAAQLPVGDTITYSVQHSWDNATWSVLYPVVAKQVGTATGTASQTIYFRLPSNTQTYVSVSATTSTGSGDCSAESMTLNYNL
jgi:hypothetical protein